MHSYSISTTVTLFQEIKLICCYMTMYKLHGTSTKVVVVHKWLAIHINMYHTALVIITPDRLVVLTLTL